MEIDDDNDDVLMHGGFNAFMKKFSGAASSAMPSVQGAGPGAGAGHVSKATSAAKRHAIPKAKSSSSKPKRPTPSVTPIGETASREKTIPLGEVGANLRLRHGKRNAEDANLGASADVGDDITETDKIVLETFFEKIKPLLVIDPPLADAGMRSWCTDHCQKLSALSSDLKAKKKSANRRRGDKVEDAAFLAELAKYEETLKELIKLDKCI